MREYIKRIFITMIAVILFQTGYAQASKSVTDDSYFPNSGGSTFLKTVSFF